MLGKKNKALAAMELTDDEIELVSGGDGLPEDNGMKELKCQYCPMVFRYHITTIGSQTDESGKRIAEFKLSQHESLVHRSPDF